MMLVRGTAILVSLLLCAQICAADLPDGTLAQIFPCRNQSSQNQQWIFATDGTNELRLQVAKILRKIANYFQMDGKCLDIEAWNTSNDATVWLWCETESRSIEIIMKKMGDLYWRFTAFDQR
jgi:hypothetical protein